MDRYSDLKERREPSPNEEDTYEAYIDIAQCTCGCEHFLIEGGWIRVNFMFRCAGCGKRYGWSE